MVVIANHEANTATKNSARTPRVTTVGEDIIPPQANLSRTMEVMSGRSQR